MCFTTLGIVYFILDLLLGLTGRCVYVAALGLLCPPMIGESHEAGCMGHWGDGTARPLLILPGSFQCTASLCIWVCLFTESCLCGDRPLGFNSADRPLSSRTGECGLAIHVKSALMR